MKVAFPERIARERRRLGYTQTDLANLVGVSQQYISMLERGDDRDCSEALATRMARRLGLEVEDIFEYRSSLHAPAVTRSKVGNKHYAVA